MLQKMYESFSFVINVSSDLGGQLPIIAILITQARMFFNFNSNGRIIKLNHNEFTHLIDRSNLNL